MLMKICKHATRGDVISAESHLPCYTMYLRDLSWFQKGIRDAGESCSDVKGENEGAPVAVVRFPIVELCASASHRRHRWGVVCRKRIEEKESKKSDADMKERRRGDEKKRRMQL